MSEVQRLVVKDDGEEYEIYFEAKDTLEIPEGEPGYRGDDVLTPDIEKVHSTIRGCAKYAIGAFKDFGAAEVEKITLKFNFKISAKAGFPILVEGSAESSFEIQVECKFPTIPKPGV